MEKDLRELCELMKTSFKEFIEFLKANPKIIGREPEMKCFFASNILLKKCGQSNILRDFTQIILESAVPQDRTKSEKISGDTKLQVCFDMTIWNEPNQSCFDESGEPKFYPLAIVEWKVKNAWGTGGEETKWVKRKNKGGEYYEDIGHTGDKTKLRDYTIDKRDEELIAFAVWLNHSRKETGTPFIKYSIFYKGDEIVKDVKLE